MVKSEQCLRLFSSRQPPLLVYLIYLFFILAGKEEFQRVAREIGEIQKQCGLKEPVEDFVEQVSKFYILVELLVLLVLNCNVNHRIQILDSLSVLFSTPIPVSFWTGGGGVWVGKGYSFRWYLQFDGRSRGSHRQMHTTSRWNLQVILISIDHETVGPMIMKLWVPWSKFLTGWLKLPLTFSETWKTPLG